MCFYRAPVVKNKTLQLLDKHQDEETIGVKYMYKVKYIADGSVPRNKARLVAKEYSQQFVVDYNEKFSFVSRLDTSRAFIVLAAHKE